MTLAHDLFAAEPQNIDDRCDRPGCPALAPYRLAAPATLHGQWCANHRPAEWDEIGRRVGG